MIAISRYLLTHKDSKVVGDVFSGLRPAIIGLIGAAAVLLVSKENFGDRACGSRTDRAFHLLTHGRKWLGRSCTFVINLRKMRISFSVQKETLNFAH